MDSGKKQIGEGKYLSVKEGEETRVREMMLGRTKKITGKTATKKGGTERKMQKE
jgi:hypothetical protein